MSGERTVTAVHAHAARTLRRRRPAPPAPAPTSHRRPAGPPPPTVPRPVVAARIQHRGDTPTARPPRATSAVSGRATIYCRRLPRAPPARRHRQPPRRPDPAPAERRPRPGPPGRHRGGARPDPGSTTIGSAAAAPAPDHVPGHHRARPDRDGRRQRRRRRLHLRAGWPGLRLQPALDAAAADPGPDRQPGDGRPARRGHRRRARAADQRAVRPVLGLVQRRRPVHPELPDHRHGVHRCVPRAAVFRRQPLHLRAASRAVADCDHRDR